MTTDLSKLMFDSRQNYMKRFLTGSVDITLGSSATSVSATVSHDLGYIPFFIVGSEQNDDSTIWSGNRVHEYTSSADLTPGNYPVQLSYYCTTSTLTITLTNGAGTGDQAGQTRTAHYVIYLDYQNL